MVKILGVFELRSLGRLSRGRGLGWIFWMEVTVWIWVLYIVLYGEAGVRLK